jgi:hypothetical protein
VPNNTQSFPGGGSGGGSNAGWQHPFGPGWGMRNPVFGRGPEGVMDMLRSAVARSRVFAPPTMVHPDRPIATFGHADPNDHFMPKGSLGGGPVHPFQQFYESHLRAGGRRSP